MEDILYVKAEQNVAVKKKDLQIKDVATLYSSNTAMVQKLEKEPFYTLPGDSKILTMFTVTKIYEAVHKVYPKIQKSSTRREDLLLDQNELEAVYIMRKALGASPNNDGNLEQIINLFRRTKNNKEFIETIKKIKLH